MKNLFLLVVLCFCSYSFLYSQDIHFTNYNAQPLILNPALTGLNGCDWRVGANFKAQWLGVSGGNTYRTSSAYADFAMGKPTKFSNFGGVGISLFSDQAGDLNYNTNKVDVSFAYHIMLNKRATSSLSVGLQAGFAHRGFDQSRALFAFDPITGDPIASSVETFDAQTRFYGDAGAGFLYSTSPKKNSNYFFGLALQHLNQPNVSSFNINRDQSERMYMKLTIHGGALIPLNDQLGLMPGFMFLKQGPTYEANLSALMKYKFSKVPNVNTAMYFGVMYRVQDAIALIARTDVKGFQIHFSYDLNLSKLTSASKANGGPEVAVVYTGCFNRKNNQRYCPAGF
jgi:type IX secretion system PorP/SprF family membrane protein